MTSNGLLDCEPAKKPTFSIYGFDRRLVKAVATEFKFVHPTDVQDQTFCEALKGRDIYVCARTGTGKTLAFALPLLQVVLNAMENESASGVLGVILAPTPMLAAQISKVLHQLRRYCGESISIQVISSKENITQTSNVIVATPKSLSDRVKKGKINLESVRFLAVDEADLIEGYGYDADLKAVVSGLPKSHQSILTSATLNESVDEYKSLILNNPFFIKLNKIEGSLTQMYMECPLKDKYLVVIALIQFKILQGKNIFFVSSVEECYKLKLMLESFSIPSGVLNAELPHNSRQHCVDQFNRGVFENIIATDEAIEVDEDENDSENDEDIPLKTFEGGVSRGIDFKNVSTVVNFDFPTTFKSYSHRIGRTARGGSSGSALSIVSPQEKHLVEQVAEKQKDAKTGQIEALDFDMKRIEGLRYRVEDMQSSITKSAVKEARLKEIEQEMINSDKLSGHFEDNPRELNLLQHDRALRPNQVQKHLASVPDYLVPKDFVVNSQLTKNYQIAPYNKRKFRMRSKKKFKGKKRKNDPLRRKKSKKRRK